GTRVGDKFADQAPEAPRRPRAQSATPETAAPARIPPSRSAWRAGAVHPRCQPSSRPVTTRARPSSPTAARTARARIGPGVVEVPEAAGATWRIDSGGTLAAAGAWILGGAGALARPLLPPAAPPPEPPPLAPPAPDCVPLPEPPLAPPPHPRARSRAAAWSCERYSGAYCATSFGTPP